MINAEFRDTISEYYSTGSCRAIKILLDPLDYMNGLIEYLRKSGYFNILDFPESTYELSQYVDTIIHMFIQGYVNYFNNKELPVLYRSASECEFNRIKYEIPVQNFLSTSRDYKECLYFASEKESLVSNNTAEYIIKLHAETKIPHINALKDSEPVFEKNEIVLLPNCHIKLGKEVLEDSKNLAKNHVDGMYEATIAYQLLEEQDNYELLNKYYNEIVDSFSQFAPQIISAVKNLTPLHNNDYIKWSRIVQKYFKILESIIYTELKNGMRPESVCRKLQKGI